MITKLQVKRGGSYSALVCRGILAETKQTTPPGPHYWYLLGYVII